MNRVLRQFNAIIQELLHRIDGDIIQPHFSKGREQVHQGLSSSAAICVLVAQAFNQLYNLHLNTMGIMNIAYWGEQRTPSRCGRLDQACAFGIHPVSMVFDGNEIKVERITVKSPLHYVFADLMSKKDTVKILADLNSGYPFARNEKEYALHEALGRDNLAITSRAREYISNGEIEKLGMLMTEAQTLFDLKVAPMCPDELGAPVLHSVLNDPYIKNLTFGGKGVGSQGDGTVQFLAKDKQSQSSLIRYLYEELGMPAYPLSLYPQTVIRKAIVPVAGFGTRLYPETRFIKKELCPVVDSDGLVKPILGCLVSAKEHDPFHLILYSSGNDIVSSYYIGPYSLHWEEFATVMWANEVFDPERPDTFFERVIE